MCFVMSRKDFVMPTWAILDIRALDATSDTVGELKLVPAGESLLP